MEFIVNLLFVLIIKVKLFIKFNLKTYKALL